MVVLVSGCWPAPGEGWGCKFTSWVLKEGEEGSEQTMMFLEMSFEGTSLGEM